MPEARALTLRHLALDSCLDADLDIHRIMIFAKGLVADSGLANG